MQQRDIIQDQIEQLGKVLGKGLALILGLKSEGDIIDVLEQVTTTLLEQEIDLKQLLQLEQLEFEQTLKEKFLAKEPILEQLGDLLFELGKGCAPEGELRQQYLEKALWTFNYINQISITFSMERLMKIKEIKSTINRLDNE